MVFGVVDLLVDWRYAVPLVLNLTGSVWFFLILGSAGECGGFLLLFWTGRGEGIGEGVRGEGKGRGTEQGYG